jgi:hypothetical protein
LFSSVRNPASARVQSSGRGIGVQRGRTFRPATWRLMWRSVVTKARSWAMPEALSGCGPFASRPSTKCEKRQPAFACGSAGL